MEDNPEPSPNPRNNRPSKKISFASVPLVEQSNRVSSGQHVMEGCCSFFRERCMLEERISMKLLKGGNYNHLICDEISGSSTQRALRAALTTSTERTVTESNFLVSKLRSTVCSPLEEALAQQREQIIAVRSAWSRSARRVTNEENDLLLIKLKLHQANEEDKIAHHKLQEARKKLNNATTTNSQKPGNERLEGICARTTQVV